MRPITLMLILAAGCYQGLPQSDDPDDPDDPDDTWSDSTTANTTEVVDALDLAVCQPGGFYSCYDGPPETFAVGVCQAGRRRCEPDGRGFGPCTDMVLPTPEDCDTPEDDDCDGSNACGGLQEIFARSGVRLHDVAGGPDRLVLAWSDLAGAHLTNLYLAGDPEHTIDLGIGLSVDDKVLLVRDPASGALTLGATLTGAFAPAADRPQDCAKPAGAGDILLARFDADLTLSMSRCWGDETHQRLTALDVPADGEPRIAGLFSGTLAFGASPDYGPPPLTSAGQEASVFFVQLDSTLTSAIWSHSFDAKSSSVELPSIVATAEGAVAFGTLRGGPESAGGSDVFITSYQAGKKGWTQQLGNRKDQISRDIAVAPDGAVWIVGESQGFLDLGDGPSADESTLLTFVARLDPESGEPRANYQVAGLAVSASQARALKIDPLGDATLVGTASDPLWLGDQALPAAGGHDVVVAKLSSTGTVRWAKRLGDGQDQLARAIALDTDANIIIGGEFVGALSDGGVSIHTDTSQLFLLRLKP